MKKLEDIAKKNIFEVPDGYFDRLPGIVQNNIAEKSKNRVAAWTFVLRYAMPILILAGIGIFWFNNNSSYQENNLETELEALQPSQLSIYLDDTDLSTEDIVETVTWSEEDLKELEDQIFSSMEVTGQELEDMLNEYDVEL
jgi:hypothetical protein